MTLAKQKKYDCNLTDLREMNNFFYSVCTHPSNRLKKTRKFVIICCIIIDHWAIFDSVIRSFGVAYETDRSNLPYKIHTLFHWKMVTTFFCVLFYCCIYTFFTQTFRHQPKLTILLTMKKKCSIIVLNAYILFLFS